MKIKVCGMREEANVKALAGLGPDYIGMIFHPGSARFVRDPEPFSILNLFPQIKKVGVFVNANLEDILTKVIHFKLDYVQLHGDENPAFCASLEGFVPVIKAFRLGKGFDFSQVKAYESVCDLFVFDAKGSNYGGNGLKYDWEILRKYEGETAFLLSGGIGPDDVEAVKAFAHPQCLGLDLNSGFETAPALKDISLLKNFFQAISPS